MKLLKMRVPIRFRLRTLLYVPFVVAIATVGYGYHLRALERQELAFRKIAALGGTIEVRTEEISVCFSRQTKQVWCGSGLERVIEPTNFQPKVMRVDLAVLDDVPKLKFVSFENVEFDRSAIEELRRLRPKCKFYENAQEL